jgi:glycosyltransferase involved in cell wall biosynthesis
MATFALAMDRADIAAAALRRLPPEHRAVPVLRAQLAWREGRLFDALRELKAARGRRARRLRTACQADLRLRTGQLAGRVRPLASSSLPPTPGGTDAAAAPASGQPQSAERAGAGRPGAYKSAAKRSVRRDAAPPPATTSSFASIPGRVLHLVTDALPSVTAGYTVRTHQIAVAQRQAGLDPHVLTRAGFPVAQGHFDARRRVRLDGVTCHRLLPYWLPAGPDAAFLATLEGASRLVERLRPAVLHAASNHVNGQLAVKLRERHGLPVVYEVRGFLEESWRSRASGDVSASDAYRLARELETWCMDQADLVVTLGEAMREEIVSRGIPGDKIVVVPNAVPAEFLGELPDGGPLRERLGLHPGDLVPGLVSSLYAHEGVPCFLEAAALLRRKGVPVRPLIVGDGPERGNLEHLARQLGLDGAAVFTGRVPVSEVRRYHAVLDLFVIPRTNDRVCQLVTPLKPVEAMASGLCVVASELAALREIVEHKATGTLITAQDPVALANCLESLLYSPGVRRELGTRAREWVAQERIWARNADDGGAGLEEPQCRLTCW